MKVTYDEPSGIFFRHHDFWITLTHDETMADRPIELTVNDDTYQYAAPLLTTTEARQLGEELLALVARIEGGEGNG